MADMETGKPPVETGSRTPAAITEKTPPDRGVSRPGAIIVVFLANVLVTAAMLYAYDAWYAEKVVTMDIDAKVEKLRENYLARRIDEKELKRRLALLRYKIEEIADRKVILKREAIVAGGKDVSDEIEIED